MSLFTFTFLESEFLFVDMNSFTVSGDKSVNAQNYALGASVVGFALYPLYSKLCKRALQAVISILAAVLSVVCHFLICSHSTYAFTLCSGLVLFLI
ncbi:LuxR family transcriptional regulator, partial [[Eubacterium] siraeum]|nr:LuxR family transcriptional regulator [[Eubacterium] siraeum]